MSNTMNMNPKNLMMLAALGIGAYFLATRRANAGTTAGRVPAIWSQSPTRAITANGQPGNAGQSGVVSAGLNLLNSLIGKTSGSPSQQWASEVNNPSQAGDEAYGWQYFTDGTSISPEGVYYKSGVPVYTPDMAATNTVSGYPTSYQNY